MSGLVIPEGLIVRKAPARPKHQPIKLDYRRFGQFGGPHISDFKEFENASRFVVTLHEILMDGKDRLLKDGDVVMTGWKMESPFISGSEIEAIQKAAALLADKIDAFWSDGIGGSFLGILAGVEGVKGSLELFNLLSRKERGGAPLLFSPDTTWTRLIPPGCLRS